MTSETQTTQCSLHLEDSNVEVLLYASLGNIKYKIFSKEALLFFGDKYRPSPLHPPFSLPSIIGMLAIILPSPDELSLSSGNVAKHTREQLEWYKTPEYINLYLQVNDYEGGNARQKSIAQNYFEKRFIEYIEPPVFNLYQAVGKQHYCPKRTRYTATILIGHNQLDKLVRLLTDKKTDSEIRRALRAALRDDFKKIKNHPVFETVLFEGNNVTWNQALSTPKPNDILSRLTEPYL
jgi:hypothetical protein